VQETGRDSGVDNTYGGLALVRGAETLHLGHLLIGRLIRHAGLLRAVATLWVSSDGVLGVVVSAVVVVVVVEMKSGVRGAGLGCEGGRRRLLLR
jgi:hypothetical protein